MKFKCNLCGLVEKIPFNDSIIDCFSCNGKMHPVGPFYVNVYIINQAYGGPQEGGWWYSFGEPIESKLCKDFNEMIMVKNKKLDWCRQNNEGRRPPSSVLSNGIFEVWVENYPARSWPSNSPTYE